MLIKQLVYLIMFIQTGLENCIHQSSLMVLVGQYSGNSMNQQTLRSAEDGPSLGLASSYWANLMQSWLEDIPTGAFEVLRIDAV